MARLLADEDFPMPAVHQLRLRQHDVWAVEESDKAGTRWPEDEVFREAQAQGRTLLTLNRRYFLALHYRHPGHAGLIVCTYNPDFAQLSAMIHDVVSRTSSLAGQCLRIYRQVP